MIPYILAISRQTLWQQLFVYLLICLFVYLLITNESLACHAWLGEAHGYIHTYNTTDGEHSANATSAQVSGSQMQREKEAAAEIMRQKQAKGLFFFPHPPIPHLSTAQYHPSPT